MTIFWERAVVFLDRAVDLVYRTYVLFVNCLFAFMVISHFGFEGKTLVLIEPVPDALLTFTFLHFTFQTGPN